METDKQMKLFEEGGLTDDGLDFDPVSGNEIPPGSNAVDVRDDVDAKLSENEYVVPADVVRYFGVNYFEKLRQKAKAGLEEMDRDGRIGGDPVEEQMGSMMDDGLPFSDEELMSIDDEAPIGMNEGGDVSALASSGFNPMAFQPGFSFGLPGSGQGATTGLPSETKTFVNAQGEIRSILFINGQPIQQIPAGFVEDTPENRAKFQESVTPPSSSVESTSTNDRDRDRDRGIQPPQSTGERKSGYSLSEDQLKALDEDPAAFGQAALKGDVFTGRNLGTALGFINPVLGLLGVGVGTYNEMRDVAAARSALEVMKSRNLTDTPEYIKLAAGLEAREKNLSLAAKGLDSLMDFSGETGAKPVLTPDPAPMTPAAIPTSGVTTSPSSGSGSSNSEGSQMGSAIVAAGSQPLVVKKDKKDKEDKAPTPPKTSTAAKAKIDAGSTGYSSTPKTTTTTTKKSTPSGASSAAKAKIDAGSTGYSPAPKKETFAEKESRGWGGLNKGGLVQRPKKKPVAKK